MSDEKKSFLSIFEEFQQSQTNGHAYPNGEDLEETLHEEESFLTEEIDHEILMHRDSHFGGSFHTMIDYYEQEGIGVYPDFELDRIRFLAAVEQELGQDIAPLFLSDTEMEWVSRAQAAYRTLKELYEHPASPGSLPHLLADLILSEEEEPRKELDQIIALKGRVVPDLLTLIRADESYDPLFPGYGQAAALAAFCLGEIGDPETIRPLFEMLGRDLPFEEGVILQALAKFGPRAKEFLLPIMKSRPITQDNITAAYALSIFIDEPKIAAAALEQLEDDGSYSHPLFCTYLVSIIESLKNQPERTRLEQILTKDNLPESLRTDLQALLAS